MSHDKAIVTCALTGVLTDPSVHPVPGTPEEMAAAARDAFNAGASVVHCHFRRQEPGMGRLPSWDPEVAGAIIDAIRAEVPQLSHGAEVLFDGVALVDMRGRSVGEWEVLDRLSLAESNCDS